EPVVLPRRLTLRRAELFRRHPFLGGGIVRTTLCRSASLSPLALASSPAMVTDFQKQLREIREAKDLEARARRAVDQAAAHDRIAALEHRFDRRDKMVKVVEEHADNFAAEVEAFGRSKSFFEGMYQIELSGDEVVIDETGALSKTFSRITFLLDPGPAGAAKGRDGVLVRCKKTVRSRDVESTAPQVEADDETLERFREYVTQQFLDFAQAYFSDSRRPTTIS